MISVPKYPPPLMPINHEDNLEKYESQHCEDITNKQSESQLKVFAQKETEKISTEQPYYQFSHGFYAQNYHQLPIAPANSSTPPFPFDKSSQDNSIDYEIADYLKNCSSGSYMPPSNSIHHQLQVPSNTSHSKNNQNIYLPPQTEAEYYWYQKDIASQQKIVRLKQKVQELRKMLKIEVTRSINSNKSSEHGGKNNDDSQVLNGSFEITPNEVFKCDICPKEYKSKRSLKYHKMIHDRAKWKGCLLCNYATPYSFCLMKHTKLKHPDVHANF